MSAAAGEDMYVVVAGEDMCMDALWELAIYIYI